MRKRMNTWIAIGLLTAFTLTGCGSSNNSASAAGTSVASQPAASTEAAQPESKTEEAEKVVVRAVTNGSPLPYVSQDENGNLGGYDILLFQEIFSRLPQYDLQLTLSSDSLTGLLSGQADVSVNNWGYRAERAESYYYSYPYKYINKVFVQRKGDEPIQSFEDISERGYKTETGTSGMEAAAYQKWNEANPDKQIIVEYSEADLATKFQRLLDGALDYLIIDGPMFEPYMQTFGITELEAHELTGETEKQVLPTVYTYFLFSKDETGAALREDVNAVIKEMYEDGSLAAFSEKNFGVDTTPPATEFESTIN